MSCWEALGIQETTNIFAIKNAYVKAKKISVGKELERLDEAYQSALNIVKPSCVIHRTKEVISSPQKQDKGESYFENLSMRLPRKMYLQLSEILDNLQTGKEQESLKAFYLIFRYEYEFSELKELFMAACLHALRQEMYKTFPHRFVRGVAKEIEEKAALPFLKKHDHELFYLKQRAKSSALMDQLHSELNRHSTFRIYSKKYFLNELLHGDYASISFTQRFLLKRGIKGVIQKIVEKAPLFFEFELTDNQNVQIWLEQVMDRK